MTNMNPSTGRTLRDIIPGQYTMMAIISGAHQALSQISEDGLLSVDRIKSIRSAKKALYLNACANGGEHYDADKTADQVLSDAVDYANALDIENLPEVIAALMQHQTLTPLAAVAATAA